MNDIDDNENIHSKNVEGMEETEQDVDDNNSLTEKDSDNEEEEDPDELKRQNTLVTKVLIYQVGDYRMDIEEMKQNITDTFRLKNINILKARILEDKRGFFQQCVAEIAPTSLAVLWGRCLGVKNCAIIEYIPPQGL